MFNSLKNVSNHSNTRGEYAYNLKVKKNNVYSDIAI